MSVQHDYLVQILTNHQPPAKLLVYVKAASQSQAQSLALDEAHRCVPGFKQTQVNVRIIYANERMIYIGEML
jgi:hypothetical protein